MGTDRVLCLEQFLCRALLISLECLSRALFNDFLWSDECGCSFLFFLFFFGGRESSSQLKSLFIKFFEKKKQKDRPFFSSDETKRHLLDELRFINARNK